jgi:DNA-binding HxlR family transcriptional regulator
LSKNLKHNRSKCPIVSTLDIVGDKWTLVVLRDLQCGKKLYGEFLESPEGISTNILAERLKRLESFGLIKKVIYQKKLKWYEYVLTPKGRSTLPILHELSRWGNQHINNK